MDLMVAPVGRQEMAGVFVSSKIELADLVASLRSEIDRAWTEGADSKIAFEAGPIQIELST